MGPAGRLTIQPERDTGDRPALFACAAIYGQNTILPGAITPVLSLTDWCVTYECPCPAHIAPCGMAMLDCCTRSRATLRLRTAQAGRGLM
ncbi:hypothetical protein GLUCOINTEAF2_0201062 [Komagataeibacter intermedius AF2]|uniref:Uncharacterized protein n=1 Tax=Komagataeibacter intermedius AF2 TaxID=1458464 RepID=A0A0N1FMH8_9PROT|nr:hypothetical protein GLUCOINTEAF2_0201062 [Komagataeibacter intermedius AF2]